MCSSYAGRQAEVIKRMFAKNSREGRTVEHGCGPLTHPSVSGWSPPPQDDNSKASLILCVWHTSLILGQIRFQPLSSSPFRFPLFLFFLFYIHVIHSQELLGFGGCRTGDVDSEKNVHSLFRMIDIKKERKLTDILCVLLCSSKKQTRKKKLDQSLLPP